MIYQKDCFSVHIKFWKLLGIYPDINKNIYYTIYSIIFVTFFIFFFDFFVTINFLFLPKKLDLFVEELLFYLTEVAVSTKVITFIVMSKKILILLDMLESDIFQPNTKKGKKIIEQAKKFNVSFWRVNAAISYISYLVHVSSPLLGHVFQGIELQLPVCSYSFLPDGFKKTNVYLIYLYQCIGMHFHMVVNVNIDSFILGLMILAIAQLDVLDDELRNVTDLKPYINEESLGEVEAQRDYESEYIIQLNKCILHYVGITKYCAEIQEVFSIILFVQFSAASIVICVCLFRFTLPASNQYFIFLLTYIIVMIVQILLPCLFGIRIIDKSRELSIAIYNCDWTPRSRQFKSSLRVMVERFSRPITLSGWKLFPLSLVTFTSIMNSAYSFFTLLRHMQLRQNEVQ